MKTFVIAAVAAVALSGCAHQVAFQDANYVTDAQKQKAAVVAVIDQQTLDRVVPIRSFLTGIANTWEAQPGQMLKQVADIELPQMFSDYSFATSYSEPQGKGRGITLALSVPTYDFSEFRASVSVRAVAYGSGKRQLLEKTYSAQGDTQGGKMGVGGAFGMKSAIRQSSLDAYKKIFAQLRVDLEEASRKAKIAGR